MLYENKKGYIAAAFLGVLAFLIIYEITPLLVTNDNWIMAGYDESDILQHYAGWVGFRNSNWGFPLGLARNIAAGDGTIISFTDSIPIVAIFFKLFRKLLPKTFQYFGIYGLLCFILQGISAFKLLRFKSKSDTYSLIGTVLFLFSPIMLERNFRHTALASHWIILFAIYIYFRHKEKPNAFSYIYMMLLEVLSVGIHPYFLPMVACFSLLCLIEDVRHKRVMPIAMFLSGFAITYLFGWIIGVLGHGVSPSRRDYGFYSMNLNALFNPRSLGGYNWSRLLKIRHLIRGNIYESFNYLGVGVFLMLMAILVVKVLFGKIKLANIKSKLVTNCFLMLVCMCLCLFAISNVITFNDKILLEFPLPRSLLYLCNIFRASSRLFWPVFYLIFIYALYEIWGWTHFFQKERVYFVLTLLIIIQLVDLSSVIKQKHNVMSSHKHYADSLFCDNALKKIAENSNSFVLEKFSDYGGCIRRLSIWALNHDMDIYYPIANSGNYPMTANIATAFLRDIEHEKTARGIVIATTDFDTACLYKTPYTSIYEKDNIYFVFSAEIKLDGIN